MEITVLDTYTTGTHNMYIIIACYTVQILNAKYLVQSASFKYAESLSVFMCSTQVSHILNYYTVSYTSVHACSRSFFHCASL